MTTRPRGRGDGVNHSKDREVPITALRGCGAGDPWGSRGVRGRMGEASGACGGRVGYEEERQRERVQAWQCGRRSGQRGCQGRGRGRRPVQRADQDRQQQLRGPLGSGGAGGGRVRGGEARRGGPRTADLRVAPGPGLGGGQGRGRGPVPAGAAHPRAHRRRPGQRRRLDRAPLLRRGRRRVRVGPGRGRHEGHGRDDAGGDPRPAAQRPQAAARHRARLPRRRGGRRHLRRQAPGRRAPRPLRGRDRGDRRGRRLLLHRQRRPAAVPDRDRGEGHALDAAHRGRHRRPRVDDQQGQRHHRAVRGRRPARQARVPGPGHQVRARLPRRAVRRPGHRTRPGGHGVDAGQARRHRQDDRHHAAQLGRAHDARRRLQGQRHPRPGHRPCRRPLPARLRGRVPGRPRPHPRAARQARVPAHRQGGRDRLRRRPRRRDAARPGRRGPGRAGGAVHALRRHRRQVLRRPRHPLLRLRPAAAAARAGLRRDVPRRGRAGAGRRPALRRPGAGPLHRTQLTGRPCVPVPVVCFAGTSECPDAFVALFPGRSLRRCGPQAGAALVHEEERE
ncbi:hypothetical protein SBRY_80156 [Actinacidiphila bryophytorum]|uniref:Uncharacterized protein n=1 Tax=Actinacidiphila bryophytorum TaxID=1436133 RepID=A0A9W4H812_9ACTN|nr:hypothetical protein SBRY_80156 [Actinacidiphila bryophytorum]